MPQRPGIHRPPGHGASARAEEARQREHQGLRPNFYDRGYDKRWSKARRLHLSSYPVCVIEGCGQPATDVDHIESVRDRPDLKYAPHNFRSLCHSHHAQRTARDQGFGGNNSAEVSPRGARHPSWLRRVVVPLTVVCGPPGSGKSTYVQARAGPKDMVLDLDVIRARISHVPLHTATPTEAALRYRNSHIALLDHITSRWPAAWLIVNEPRSRWRQWWLDHVGALRIVVMEEPAPICISRIQADVQRPGQQDRIASVHSWWARYDRRVGDMILREGHRPTLHHNM